MFAALRLITREKRVGCSTGISLGLCPFQYLIDKSRHLPKSATQTGPICDQAPFLGYFWPLIHRR